MFFQREQYTTRGRRLQGGADTFPRNRQKTGRRDLLPVAFVQFYGPAGGCVSQSSAPRRKNSAAVVELIEQAKARGAAIVGIFHDDAVRSRVADRLHPMGTNA